MQARVSHLWRHPIKGHGVESVATTMLAAGATMPWDRVWAIADEAAKVTEAKFTFVAVDEHGKPRAVQG